MTDVRIVIIIIIVLIILAFILLLLFNLNKNKHPPTNTLVANGSVITGIGISCLPNQCVTNIYNGSKICPTLQGGSLIADPALEVCNSRFLCENPLTPYALQSDGSTNQDGICQFGVTCRCLRTPQCSANIVGVFTTSNGTPYQPFAQQRIIINQTLVQTAPNAGASKVNFKLETPLVNFCTITSSWLKNLQPGICNDLSTSTLAGVAECQSRNPCIAGTLAFIPENVETFDTTQINVTSLGCVYGKACSSTELTVWNNNTNSIVCLPIT